jgi:hypothetical protein
MTCTAVPCGPGAKPVWQLPPIDNGGPAREVWVRPEEWCTVTNCLPCEYQIGDEGTGYTIFKVDEDDPTNLVSTGISAVRFLGEATDIVQRELLRRGYDFGLYCYDYWPPCRCGCAGECICGARMDYLDLSDVSNVYAVDAVIIAGVILPQIDPVTNNPNWRLDDCRRLVKLDPHASCTRHGECGCSGAMGGATCWPNEQRPDLIGRDVDCTWHIRYRYGTPVPAAVQQAVACVACRIMKEALCIPCEDQLDGIESYSQLGLTVNMSAVQKSMDAKSDTYGCPSYRRVLSQFPETPLTGWYNPANVGCGYFPSRPGSI